MYVEHFVRNWFWIFEWWIWSTKLIEREYQMFQFGFGSTLTVEKVWIYTKYFGRLDDIWPLVLYAQDLNSMQCLPSFQTDSWGSNGKVVSTLLNVKKNAKFVY